MLKGLERASPCNSCGRNISPRIRSSRPTATRSSLSTTGVTPRRSNVRCVRALTAIRANGSYNEIRKKYFDFDIYGD